MKSKKVLFGLFMGLFTLASATTWAQNNAASKIIEIGPDNIGGRVTSLIIDQRDATNNTIFAGASTGGLFVRSNNVEDAKYPDIWNYVPCTLDGKQRVLPISDMIQLPDNTICIATGEGCFTKGTKFSSMASKGVGIVRFDPDSKTFTPIKYTDPTNNDAWTNVNKLAYAFDEATNTLYFFAAAKGGLYRWAVKDNNWLAAPVCLIDTVEMLDVAVVNDYSMVYFASKNRLYRISSFDGTNVVDVTKTNSVFSSASRIQLATTPSNPDYLYAMVTASNGKFKGLYLTINQNSWTLLTTATVAPFESGAGLKCGAVCVDANNSKHIFIGGSSLWEGQGYTDGAIFQWTMSSYNEKDMGSTNFMDEIFSSSYYVHSGINDIKQVQVQDKDGKTTQLFYIATNAGIFEADSAFSSFRNINRGLNNVQVNGVAVSTDGSLIIGADYSANLFIEARQGHHLSGVSPDASVYKPTWYDSIGSGTNHIANEYWQGNGGQVAISQFQQYAPMSRRNIFFSAENGLYARSYADYSNYSNTQTWTIGESFLANEANSGNAVAQMHLWESQNMSGISNVSHNIDTNDEVLRPGVGAIRIGCIGSNLENSCNGKLKRGDTIIVPNVATASYPFRYVFTESMNVDHNGTTLTVDNPIQSHLFILVRHTANANGVISKKDKVAMSWTPADFTRVYSTNDGTVIEPSMGWGDIYMVDKSKAINKYRGISTFGISADGDQVLVVVANDTNDSCFVVRVQGILSNVDYHKDRRAISRELGYADGTYTDGPTLVADTLVYNGSIWFPRNISSIVMDKNDRAIFTFEGHDNKADFANVLVMNHASGDYTFADKSISGKMAAYSALVETTKGDIFIGTEDGLYKTTASSFNSGSPAWKAYGEFTGVPVTALTQQVNDLPIQRMTLHDGINTDNYVFPRTKYPYAIYIGTYGRGVFMDSTYVTNHDEEVLEEIDYVGITPVVKSAGLNKVSIYPNPASIRATMDMTIAKAGNAILKVYDIAGKVVVNKNLGRLSEGSQKYSIDCSSLNKGMYLVNLIIGGESSATKLIVR